MNRWNDWLVFSVIMRGLWFSSFFNDWFFLMIRKFLTNLWSKLLYFFGQNDSVNHCDLLTVYDHVNSWMIPLSQCNLLLFLSPKFQLVIYKKNTILISLMTNFVFFIMLLIWFRCEKLTVWKLADWNKLNVSCMQDQLLIFFTVF